MNAKIVLVGLLFVVALNFIPFEPTINNVHAQSFSKNALYVGGAGLNNYTKIQDAINASSNGDTIFVYQGTYYEHIFLNKTIHLMGEDKDTTIIDGNGIGNVIYISANDTSVSGFTIKNSGNEIENAGITICSLNNSISDNKIVDNQHGIRVLSENNSITRNVIFDNFEEIYSLGNNTISDNSNKPDVTYSTRTITVGNNNVSIFSVNCNTSNAFITEKGIKNYTIKWKGNTTSVTELPSTAVAIRLPDRRIGIKFADGKSILLPRNSTILDKNEIKLSAHVVIEAPDWNRLIYVSNIKTLSIENLTSISYSQHVSGLRSYNLKTDFFGLRNYKDYIASYWIDWGDDHRERISIPRLSYTNVISGVIPTQAATLNIGETGTVSDRFSISHKYRNSGTYSIKIGIADTFGNKYIVSTQAKIRYEGTLRHTYFVIVEYKEPIAATSGGVGLTSLLTLIFLTEPGKYKFLSFLVIPLFVRIKKEDMLDNFVRGQIYGMIKVNPGVHYNDIMRKLELKNGTLSYHLQMLEKTGMIKSRMEGLRYRAFYPTGMKFPEKERYRLSELQIEILKIVRENDGIIQNEIKNKLGENRQKINYNVKVLRRAGLVKVLRRGRKTHCYLTEESQCINEFADISNDEGTISS